MLACEPLHQDRATGRQVREAVLNLLLERHRGVGQKRPVTQVEAELAMSLTNEIEYGQALFLVVQSQATAELLQKDRQTFGRAQEKHRVELGNVDTLIVQVDDEQEVQLTAAQAVLGRVAVGPRGLCR